MSNEQPTVLLIANLPPLTSKADVKDFMNVHFSEIAKNILTLDILNYTSNNVIFDFELATVEFDCVLTNSQMDELKNSEYQLQRHQIYFYPRHFNFNNCYIFLNVDIEKISSIIDTPIYVYKNPYFPSSKCYIANILQEYTLQKAKKYLPNNIYSLRDRSEKTVKIRFSEFQSLTSLFELQDFELIYYGKSYPIISRVAATVSPVISNLIAQGKSVLELPQIQGPINELILYLHCGLIEIQPEYCSFFRVMANFLEIEVLLKRISDSLPPLTIDNAVPMIVFGIEAYDEIDTVPKFIMEHVDQIIQNGSNKMLTISSICRIIEIAKNNNILESFKSNISHLIDSLDYPKDEKDDLMTLLE